MAELTNLETKLGEVLGLAMAAQGATEKVSKLDDLDGELCKALERMHDEAKQAEERATKVAGELRGQEDRDPRRGPRGEAEGDRDDAGLPRPRRRMRSTASSS